MSGEDAHKGRRVAIIGASALLLVAMVVAVTVGVNRNQNGSDDGIEDNRRNHVASSMKAVQTICHPAEYKKECEDALTSEAKAGNITDPKELIKIAFNVTIKKIGEKLKETNLMQEVEKDPRSKDALDTCKQLMDLSIGEFTRSLDGMGEFHIQNLDKFLMNVKVWLNGAVTYMDTCVDGFENTTTDAGKKMKELLTSSMHMGSNALAIISDFADTVSDWNVTNLLGGRRLLDDSDTPSWADHRILLDSKTKTFKHEPDVTVALDGSGDVKSINEALTKVPEKSKKPFVIFIKAGIYAEYVEITKHMTNVVFIGEGGKKSVITGNKNFIDGINTYRTATVGMSVLIHAYM
jgi:pectinesterase